MSITVVKIAPGRRAKYWDQCREAGYICVGWDDVRDLTAFHSKQAFLKTFDREYLSKYNGSLSTTHRKANELWTLVELLPGDKIIANKGLTEVLAVGTVKEPGYKWLPSRKRPDYYHTVKVKWDEAFRTTVMKQPWNNTVAPVTYELFKKIAGSAAPPASSVRDLDDLNGDAERIARLVKDRQGQPDFRERLLLSFGRRCAVSDCDAAEALEAAHIRPYVSEKSNHPCNGLLLRADLHTLFDKHLLGIHPEKLTILISPSLMSTVYRKLNGRKLRVPALADRAPDRKCLEDRYRLYRVQNGLAN